MYCNKCGKELLENALYCDQCGTPVNNNKVLDDTPNTLVSILCFIVPIIGIILFLIWMNTFPDKAKEALKWSVISIITGIILSILLSIISIAFFFSLF